MKFPGTLFLFIFSAGFASAQNKLTLEDIWLKNSVTAKSVEGFRAMKDGAHYITATVNETGYKNYLNHDYITGSVTDTLVKGKELLLSDSPLPVKPDGFSLSMDESKILFTTETEKVYRRSSLSNNFVYDRRNKRFLRISSDGKQQAATFSPDGDHVAYVRGNNIILRNLTTDGEDQITKDGKKNFIINGVCDWVYEEEFSFTQAYQWSPDGKNIAYYRFDETEVPQYTLQFFSARTHSEKDNYPENYTYKYPKVGEKNSVVSIFIYHLDTKKTIRVEIGNESDQYIPRIRWTQNENQLCIFRMNRLQNKLELLLADAASGKVKVMLIEENKRYIDVHDNLSFFNSNKNFIWTSEMSGYNHIYIGNVSDGKLTPVTSGNYDVTKFYGVDEKRGLIYYQSAEVSPLQRYVYAISMDGKNKKQLTRDSGWNDATFNDVFTYMMVTHSDANKPPDYKLYDAKGKFIRLLEDNSVLAAKLSGYQLARKEFFSFTTNEGISLNGYMIKPQNFDEAKKYPIFMFAYGGPNSQQVTDAWGGNNFLFFEYLAHEDYIVACVDNRGTGARGEEFKKMTYLHLGKYEPIDQIAAAKYLGSLPFADATRIGIFGWSYGGYLSLLCISLGSDIFKAAVAVAPVTNWRFYDSIYTERYMRDNHQNKEGYDDGAPLTYADKIKGNLLLVAGMADDNVHYQNTGRFINTLYEHNVKFDQLTFPDRAHNLSGGNTRFYLYSRMVDWLKENL
ncbi:MAG: S9 family peptidase [Chitinophagales bacterium]